MKKILYKLLGVCPLSDFNFSFEVIENYDCLHHIILIPVFSIIYLFSKYYSKKINKQKYQIQNKK